MLSLQTISTATMDLRLRPAELSLVRLAFDLGASTCGGPLTRDEEQLLQLVRGVPRSSEAEVEKSAAAIRAGDDPLGLAYCVARSVPERRAIGAFYTPPELVMPMVSWILERSPARVVDAGCGSGRFSAEVARRRPGLPIVAVDLDPIATILTRATLGVLGAQAARVLQVDYTALDLPSTAGRTAFVGNPPYVRHHDLSAAAKSWANKIAQQLGIRLSGLAGLHVHFYLATALYARSGDVGCFVTSAEWLDVNYGAALRELLLGYLGCRGIDLVDQTAVPFADAMTTAVITCFQVGSLPEALRLRLLDQPAPQTQLGEGREVLVEHLRAATRWSGVVADREPAGAPVETIALGDFARVHRGIVTGANDFFLLSRDQAADLRLEQWCRPAITGADEVLNSDGIVRDGPERRLLLDVPADITRLAHPALDAYLRRGEVAAPGLTAIADRYIASHRRPWWFLGKWRPPPVVASYMARQAPRFALNPDGLAIVNVVHGIYPNRPFTPAQLERVVAVLNDRREAHRGSGRTYHGGLEKFEPREMEGLRIPKGIVD